jgi:hypothetical protein
MAGNSLKVLFLILSVVFCQGVLWAQNPAGLMFNYSQNNNTYTWENSYRRAINMGKYTSELNLNTESTLMKKPYKRWQENIGASYLGNYKINDGLSIAPYVSQTRNALQDRIVYTSEAKISAPYNGIKYLEISPFIGNKSLQRKGEGSNRNNWGFGYGAKANSRSVEIFGNDISAAVSYEAFDLQQIPYSDFRAELGGLKQWGYADSIKWNVYDWESSKKYYSGSSSSNNIMRQVKVERAADYLTRITLPGEYIARLSVSFLRANYYYNPLTSTSSISEYNNYTQSETYNIQMEKTFFKRIKLSSGYRWYADKQDFRGSLLDLWSELGEIALKASVTISTRDTISGDCILGVTSYYGLHGPAANERDMQTQIYNGRYKHIFNRYFWGELKGVYSNFHQIYIRSVNSASNNQNETYLLNSSFGWKLFNSLDLNQSYEIQANYISYDYDRQTVNTRNQIFRRGTSTTRLEWRLSPAFTFTPGYLYRYEDYGKLYWKENNWQQATGWDRRYHRIDLKVAYRFMRNFYFEPTHIWELRKEYNHSYVDGGVTRERKNRDLKMTTGLSFTWSFKDTDYITLSYNRRDWQSTNSIKSTSEFINVSVRYIF